MNTDGITVGCIGSGMMGGALMRAMAALFPAESRARQLFVSDADMEKAKAFASGIGATALPSNGELARQVKYLLLAVKPAYIAQVVREISPVLAADAVVVSVAAGVTLASVREAFGSRVPRLARIMPNLPATVGEAMIALCPSAELSHEDCAVVKGLLEAAGKVEVVAEKLMDGVTAVSGSGPAYAFLFIEALADAAVRFGIPRSQAYIYAAQTLKGAAALALEDGRSISELKDAVCSPAGTTIEAVASLERSGFRGAIIDAATAAFEKSIALGKN